VLVRTWNVFHGNTSPAQRHSLLPEALQLAVSGKADVVCLQELPAWSLERLEAWTEYTAVTALAARPMLGPLPSTAEIGRRITALNPGVLRSAFSGQGNAILVSPRLEVVKRHTLVLNPRGFRRAEAKQLGLGVIARLAWGKERRVCQAVRIRDGERTIVVGNMHATSYPADERLPDVELRRAFEFVDEVARTNEPVIVAGDLNVVLERSRTLQQVTSGESGFSQPGPWIDHVLARGLRVVTGPTTWPLGRRVKNGMPISDHAPVEVVVE
jgi:endonuclease/exonuclease/phosphatase family metal-dependent hydrolase